MIIDLCRETGNFFIRTSESGDFTVNNNSISPVRKKYLVGQYVAIVGGVFANGIYKIQAIDGNALVLISADSVTPEQPELSDEEFNGSIHGLAIPRGFVDLAEEINKFTAKNPQSNLTSYSFGKSSASYATNSKGMQATWQDVFAQKLAGYRKMFKDIPL